MRALLAMALALAVAPFAAATEVATPAGDGAIAAALEGEPLAVGHDAGADAGPGDDAITVEQGLREARLAWRGAPVGLGLDAGLRGARAEQGAVGAVDMALDDLYAKMPPDLLLAWPWLGPEGADFSARVLDYGHDGGEHPLTWQAMMFGQPWGLRYDAVVLPSALDGSSEGFLADRFVALLDLCAYVQEREGVALGACADLARQAQAALPDLRIHSEVQSAGLALAPAVPGSALAGASSLHIGSGVEGVAAAGPAADDEALLAALFDHLTGAPDGASPQSLARGAGPGASAQQLAAAPVPLGGALPLALAALALPLVAWTLYRRILPSRALHHPVREDLLRRVRAHPGIHESQLAREMGLRHTHVQYHIRVLAEAGVLETRRFGGLKCIFELGKHSAGEKAYAMADRGRGREVLDTVVQQPGIAQRELARALGMSESSVKWHLDRLAKAGMVRTERARGAKRAWAEPGALAGPLPAALPAAPPVALVATFAPPAPL